MWDNILQKLKNPYTAIAIVSSVVIIMQTLDFSIDTLKIETITNSICTIFVLLGIMNNPDTKGLS